MIIQGKKIWQRYFIYLKIAFVLLSIQSFTLFASANAPRHSKVLVIHSYHRGLKWTDDIAQAIDERLKFFEPRIEICHEYMDTKRIYDAGYLERLYRLYYHKYRSRKPDCVIITDDHAFRFFLKHNKVLFPGIPAVFCGVNKFKRSMLRGRSNITGIVEDIDMLSTLKVALTLHPQTNDVYAIVDNSLTGIENLARFKGIVPSFANRLRVHYINEPDKNKLIIKLRDIPSGSIVIWLHYIQDSSGRTYSFAESTEFISRYCRAPLYSFWDFNLNHGILGGMLTSGRAQGDGAAELCIRILRGESPAKIPIVFKSPNRYMFDWVKLAEYGISESDLPPGSIVVRKPLLFYVRYPRIFWSIIAGLVLFSLILVFVFIYLRLKRKSGFLLEESEARYRGIFDYGINAIILLKFDESTNDYIIMNCNRAAELIDSISAPEVKGKWLTAIYPSINKYKILEACHRVKETGVYEHLPVFYYEDNRIHGWRNAYLFRLDTLDIVMIYSDETRRIEAEKKAADLMTSLEQKVSDRTSALEESNIALQESIAKLEMAQDQLVQTEKMAALGGLVAGIAHEINTPLGVSVTASSFLNAKVNELTSRLEANELTRREMEDFFHNLNETMSILQHNLHRATQLIESFKQVSVDQSSDKRREFNMSEYLEKVLLSLKPKYKKFKHGLFISCPDNLVLDSYPGAFSQIITNLLLNALVHGFSENEQGKIEIEVKQNSEWLVFIFRDNGKGMTEEVLEHIFEPFFTTRRSQGGTGLGLHLVFNLVTQTLGGTIKCNSSPGQGAEFVIQVPFNEPGK